MRGFGNILFVPGEGSLTRVACGAAAAFAARNDARLTVMSVVESIPERRRRFETENAVYDLQDLLMAEGVEQIEELLMHVEAGCEVASEVVVVSGRWHIEVIRRVLSAEHDLVIVVDAEEGYGPATHHLLRKAPCPVWVMAPSIASEQRILATVDPNPLIPTQELLDDDVLTLAASLATQEAAPLHVVHAWSVPRGAGFGLSPSRLDALRDETLSRHRTDLASLVERHRLPDDTVVHLLEGSPAKVIRHVIRRNLINTIVMGTVARTGIAGLLIGNTAETILKSVNCSIFAVKPHGFETPVRLS